MKFEEVLPALREGEKIKRKIWYEDINYIILNENKEIISFKWGIYDALSIKDLLADDWEVIEEPNKVKLRDLTEEQFPKVRYDNLFKENDWLIKNKDLRSDKFLDQEVEIDE